MLFLFIYTYLKALRRYPSCYIFSWRPCNHRWFNFSPESGEIFNDCRAVIKTKWLRWVILPLKCFKAGLKNRAAIKSKQRHECVFVCCSGRYFICYNFLKFQIQAKILVVLSAITEHCEEWVRALLWCHRRRLRSEDSDGSENVAEKVNSRSFNLQRDYSKSLTFPNVGDPSYSWIPKNHVQNQPSEEISSSLVYLLCETWN